MGEVQNNVGKKPIFVEINGVKVMFTTAEVVFNENHESLIETNLSVVTIASATKEDPLVDDIKLEGVKNVFIFNELHNTILFQLPHESFKELIFESCKIYSNVLANEPDKSISAGFEFTYITKVYIYKDNNIAMLAVKQLPIA